MQIANNKSETEEKTSQKESENLIVASRFTAEKRQSIIQTFLIAPGFKQRRLMPISLNEAIRKALENNNSIEVARDDVRIQEAQLRSLFGNYDPIISASPTFSRSSATGTTASNDFRLNAGLDKLIRPGGGRINSFFNNSQTGRNSQNNTDFQSNIVARNFCQHNVFQQFRY